MNEEGGGTSFEAKTLMKNSRVSVPVKIYKRCISKMFLKI
jgi:hypothetical protein